MHFTLSHDALRRLAAVNSFAVPAGGMSFFGLRGALPADSDNCRFDSAHDLYLGDVNYTHPRCTLGQWRPTDGDLALFPGSTVPHLSNVKNARAAGGNGTNQLMTGFYADYRKGTHKAGKPTAHLAFRQTEGRPIRRSADDYDYQNDDRVEFANPFDNLHAAWCMSINHASYASAGCQVVVGFPKCSTRTKDEGPWKDFRESAYAESQDAFPYMLLDARDALRAATAAPGSYTARLRFGSSGPLVTELQEALKKKGFYEGELDNDFGRRTLNAVMAFQTSHFGPDADDGIVGPTTATALGFSLPSF